MNRRRKTRWLITLLFLALLAAPLLYGYQQSRHERRDAELILALRTGDYPKAMAALEAGADPNAKDSRRPASLHRLAVLHAAHSSLESAARPRYR